MGFFEQAALACSSQTVQDHHETHCTIYAVKWIENSLEGLKKKTSGNLSKAQTHAGAMAMVGIKYTSYHSLSFAQYTRI